MLANNIETVQVEKLKVEVSSNAPYAAALAFGTSKMAERLNLRPAVAKVRAEGGIAKEIVAAVNSVSGGGRPVSEAKRRSKQEASHFGGATGRKDG